MTIEIKTSVIEPRRHTYANVARRLGVDKPASRYEEATYDLQPTVNFHYRPTWDPAHELFDINRTKIVMEDWYSFRDPRQYYYGTYTVARARMTETQEKNFSFVEKRQLLDAMDDAWAEKVRSYLIPLRHYEWGANMNNCQITDLGYGAAITQVTMFAAADRLGISQIISRIGLLMDGNSGESLTTAKEAWLDAPMWQGVRHMIEDSFVVDDWFELLVAQNFAMDGIVYPMIFEHFDREGGQHGGGALSILSEFMIDCFGETKKWTDALLKVTAQESPANKELLSGWVKKWSARSFEAYAPLAEHVLGANAKVVLQETLDDVMARATKAGLEV